MRALSLSLYIYVNIILSLVASLVYPSLALSSTLPPGEAFWHAVGRSVGAVAEGLREFWRQAARGDAHRELHAACEDTWAPLERLNVSLSLSISPYLSLSLSSSATVYHFLSLSLSLSLYLSISLSIAYCIQLPSAYHDEDGVPFALIKYLSN